MATVTRAKSAKSRPGGSRKTATRTAKAAEHAAGKAAGHSARKAATRAVGKGGGESGALSKAVSAPVKHAAGSVARHAAKRLAKGVARSGANAMRGLAERGASLSHDALDAATRRRLPIQVSIDVAVPAVVAWEEWRDAEELIEGVHRIEEVRRDGDRMVGHTAGPHATEWEAEIVDDREAESFAWRSQHGSDCAGLATFHELSGRLTRIELDLDVLPRTPGELFVLSSGIGRRRAEADLRRFKARLEFMNPDDYASRVNGNDAASHDADER